MKLGSELSGFAPLKAYLIEHTGLAYYQDKDAELQDKLQQRMKKLQLNDFSAYLAYLQASPELELNQLIPLLTIGETYFFRYAEQFEILQAQILPRLLEQNLRRRSLRIWSAACATGEEIYSLAILLREKFPELESWQLELVGSDLNPECVKKARKACYREWSFRHNPASLKTHFLPTQNQSWLLKPEYRKEVRFVQHNLIQDDFSQIGPAGFDLILCRNVLIYFNKDTQQRLIKGFYQRLAPQGWLILGPSELSPLDSKPFQAQALSRLSCYQKAPRSQEPETSINQRLQASQAESPLLKLPESQTPPKLPVMPVLPELPILELLSSLSPADPAGALQPEDPAIADQQQSRISKMADQGLLAEAKQLCLEALELCPMDPDLYFQLGVIQRALAETPDALKTLQQVIYLDRQYILAHYYLGLVQLQQGATQLAAKSFRNAARLLKHCADQDLLRGAPKLSAGRLKALIQIQEKGLK